MGSRWCQRGLSLLEFTLAALVIVVLALLAFERIAAVRGDMERARVQHTVATMRSALALEFADHVVNDRVRQLRSYEGANALALLAPPPAGYRGERTQLAEAVEPGSWYYARNAGVIAYRARYPFAFDDGHERLYWRVVATRDSNGEAEYDGAPRGNGITLVRTTAHGRPLMQQDKREANEQQAETQP